MCDILFYGSNETNTWKIRGLTPYNVAVPLDRVIRHCPNTDKHEHTARIPFAPYRCFPTVQLRKDLEELTVQYHLYLCKIISRYALTTRFLRAMILDRT